MESIKITSLIDSEKRKKSFLSLEKTLKYFCRKNKVENPIKITSTHGGLICSWNNGDQVLLSGNSAFFQDSRYQLNPELQPYVGGDGSHRYSSEERTYKLSGILNGKAINLETEVSYTKDYKHVKYPNESLWIPTRVIPTEKNKRFISRKDDERYWFLKNKKNKK